jgi:hypothetical protein
MCNITKARKIVTVILTLVLAIAISGCQSQSTAKQILVKPQYWESEDGTERLSFSASGSGTWQTWSLDEHKVLTERTMDWYWADKVLTLNVKTSNSDIGNYVLYNMELSSEKLTLVERETETTIEFYASTTDNK